jgi:outer membrane protein assembly factor BamA
MIEKAVKFQRIALMLSLATAILLSPAGQPRAQVVALDQGQSIDERRTGFIPYLFASESLGTAVGAAAFSAGNFQPQASLFGTAFVTSNESALISGALSNLRLGSSRFFIDAFLLADHFTDQRFYVDYDRDPNEPRAGSNDSDRDDFARGVSNEFSFDLTLKYRLPIGSIRDHPVAVYRLNEGLLESGPKGGDVWNPMVSGQTTLAGKFFYTYRDLDEFTIGDLDTETIDELLKAKTSGLEIWLEYDNTDFPRNPSRGSRQLVKLTRDFGWLDSSETWTNLEADLSKYFNLGTSGWFRQQVLALNFWTSNTTTWKTESDNPNNVSHNPPPGYGSELGGYDRLRAFPSGRFRDKAAAYYAAELRLIPKLQPLRHLPLLKYFEIDWWQVVPFVEAGRVGPEYNSDLFVKDLKWDAGVGIRLMAFRMPVRLDFAVSDEGSSVWAMFGQPFARQGQ